MGYKTNTIRNAAGEGENKYLYYYEYRNYKTAKIAETSNWIEQIQ